MIYRTVQMYMSLLTMFFVSTCLNMQQNISIYGIYIVGLNMWFWNFFFVLVILLIYTSLNSSTCLWIIILTFGMVSESWINHIIYLDNINILPASLLLGTVLIHPFLLYLFIVGQQININITLAKILQQMLILNTRSVLVVGSVALLLGGFWGLQSAVWGYWWVSDQIEWVLLEFIIAWLLYLHIGVKQKKYIIQNLLSFVLINNLLYLRLNIISTRHSFLTSIPWTYILVFSFLTYCYILMRSHYWSSKTIFVKLESVVFLLIVVGLLLIKQLFYIFILVWHFLVILQLQCFFKKQYTYVTYVFHSTFFLWASVWLIGFAPMNFTFFNQTYTNMINFKAYSAATLVTDLYINSKRVWEPLTIVFFNVQTVVLSHYTPIMFFTGKLILLNFVLTINIVLIAILWFFF